MGPGIVVEQWFSGMAPGPAVSASPGNMQILGSQPPDIPCLRSCVILQVSLSSLKLEKPCGGEEVLEPQGFTPAGRVPSSLSREVGGTAERVSSTLALGLAGGGTLGPLLVRLMSPGMRAP